MPPATKISVIIPLFNKEHTVDRTLRSILAQTHANFEVLVIDDGSTDASVNRVAALSDSRIKLIAQTNAGPGAARNHGASLATGAYLAFLDADDEWRPTFLAKAVAALDRYGDCAAFVAAFDAGTYRSQRGNKIVDLALNEGPHPPPLGLDGWKAKAYVDAMHSSCVAIRTSDFLKFGGFFTLHGCRYGEDSWLWARILMSRSIFWTPEELTLFHVEDSDLGYAVTMRSEARPISLYPAELGDGLAGETIAALARLSDCYAQMDYSLLMTSGAWHAARRLRHQHGFGSIGSWVRETLLSLKGR